MHKYSVLAAGLLLVLTTASAATIHSGEAVDPAWRLLREGKSGEAVEAFRIRFSADPGSSVAVRGLVTALIRDGRSGEAIATAQSFLDRVPADPEAWAHLGRSYLASGRFEEAEQAFLESVSISESALGEWGLGRIAESRGDLASAEKRFKEALRTAPADAEILGAWLRTVDDPEVETEGWKRWLRIDLGSRPATRSFVEAVLPVFDQYAAHRGVRLQIREPHSVPIVFSLERLPRPAGSRLDERRFVIVAKSETGRERRLLLDTGAHGLTLSRSAARSFGFRDLCSVRLQGAGGRSRGTRAKIGVVRGFDLGPLTYRDGLAVRTSSANFPDGVDGILGVDLFAPWTLELDVDRQQLRILPMDARAEFFRQALVRRADAHILVDTMVAGRVRGWFLLDTGASHTTVELEAAEGLGGRTRSADWWIRGVSGILKDLRTVPEATVEVAGISRRDPGLLAYSLEGLSRNLGVRVAGVLGLSFFEGMVVRIDTVGAAVALKEVEGTEEDQE